MGVAPNERSRVLHDRQEAGQIVHFTVGVAAIDNSGKVEKLGTIVQLAPEAVLQAFLGSTQGALLLEKVQVGQDTENISGHTVRAQNVQKFHSLHLEAIISVDHQKHNIRDLGHIDHAGEGVGGAFEEGKAAPFGGHNSQRSLRGTEGLFCVSTDQGLDKCRFPNL